MKDRGRIQEIGSALTRQGHKVTMPLDTSETRFSDRKQSKALFMKEMFNKIKDCDSVLAVNDSSRGGLRGYIGPNTFLQLGMGMSLGKTLFSLAKWDEQLPYNDELEAMGIQQLDIALPS